MSLERKLKIGLDETRLLILGSQVLIGFQFHAAFQQLTDALPDHAKYLFAIGLLLMVTTLGLLVAPSTQHRLVEQGNTSKRLVEAISTMADLALMPFAVSLGIGVFIATEQIFGTKIALITGPAYLLLALLFWYGIEWWQRRRNASGKAMTESDQQQQTKLSDRIDHMLTEARVILPGAQALLGFQLVIVLTEAFEKLPASSKLMHAVALGCVALAIILLMAPAAYHRIVFDGRDTEEMHRIGSRFVTAATVPLIFGLCADIYVTVQKILESSALGIGAAVIAFLLLVLLWHIYPLVLRFRRARTQSPAARKRQTA